MVAAANRLSLVVRFQGPEPDGAPAAKRLLGPERIRVLPLAGEIESSPGPARGVGNPVLLAMARESSAGAGVEYDGGAAGSGRNRQRTDK